MNFINEDDKRFLQRCLGTKIDDNVILTELYVDSKGAYLNRALQYKRAILTKMAWVKYRYNFKSGIRRYHNSARARHSLYKRESFDILKSALQINESVVTIKVEEFDRFLFLQDLNWLKYVALTEGTYYFPQEESRIDYLLFLETVGSAVSSFESLVFSGKTTDLDQLEVILNLYEPEVVSYLSEMGEHLDPATHMDSLLGSLKKVWAVPGF